MKEPKLKKDRNQKTSGTYKAKEKYLLTGVFYCTGCGNMMIGDSCINRHGKNYKYYKCATIKKKTGTCELKLVYKDYIETFIV